MKKSILLYSLIFITVIGLLVIASCKRNAVEDPQMGGPAGFRIILSGTANPSTLYVPEVEPAVYSTITLTALHNDGTPASGYDIIFQAGDYGYFDNYKISDTRRTNANGVVQISFFIPPLTNIRATIQTNITVTLVDDGRLDSTMAQVTDTIPIRIIPYVEQGLIIHGNVTTPTGTGVGGVVVTLDSGCCCGDGVTVTRSSGSYEFYVPYGWYGTITPNSNIYSFVPSEYSYTEDCPLLAEVLDLDFIAMYSTGDTLAVDVQTWQVPVEGGTQFVNVYNSTGDNIINYTAITSASYWLTVSPVSGSTPGSFTITALENTTGVDRNATITVQPSSSGSSAVTITVNQLSSEVSGDATLAVDRQNLNVASAGGAEAITVYNSTTSESINFIVTSNDSWITTSAATGSASNAGTPLTLTISANDTGAARTGTVTLTATSTGVTNPTLTITVNQEIAQIAVDTPSYSALSSAGETFTVRVTNSTDSENLTWSLTTDGATWLGFSQTTGDTTANNTFVVTVQTANPGSSIRVAIITVTAGNGSTAEVRVEQAGS